MRVRRVLGAVCLASVVACSIFTDLGDLSDGSSTAPDGSGQDGSLESSTLAPPVGPTPGSTDGATNSEAGFDAGSLPPCPADTDPNTLFVDAKTGSPSGTGAASSPVDSITSALVLARNIASATPLVICVRAGTYANEPLPIALDVGGVTVRGEGADKVTLKVPFTDAGATGPTFSIEAADVTLQGMRVDLGNKDAIQNFVSGATNLMVTDMTLVRDGKSILGGVISGSNRMTIARSTITVAAPSSCIYAGPAQLEVLDSTISGCDCAINSATAAPFILRRTTIKDSQNAICGVGLESLTTESCTFAGSGLRGVILQLTDSFRTWESTNDTFTENKIGVEILTQAGGNSVKPEVTMTGATFTSQVGAGIRLAASPLKMTLRGSTFKGGSGSAVQVDAPTVPADIDLGDEANTFQSTAQSNTGAGICLRSAGTLTVSAGKFAHCPPHTQPDKACTGSIDTGSPVDGGQVVVTNCSLAQ